MPALLAWTPPPLLQGTTRLFQIDIPLAPWAVIVLLAAAGLAFHILFRTVLVHWAKGTDTDIDDILLEISARAVPLWIGLSILYVALEMAAGSAGGEAGVAPPLWHAKGITLIVVAFVVSLFWFVSALLLRAMANWARRNAAFQPVYPPFRFVLKAVMVVLGALTVLNYLGVEVGPILATLGVGGLAVALALRDTLENFFAGLHIMADRPVSEGDAVVVHETGDRGTVLKVGWRSTRIRTADNNILVVPNQKLSSGIVTNLTAQDPSTFVRLQVGVSYDSDADRVREILLEEARAAAAAVPGVAAAPPPEAWLHPGFGPSSLDFTLRVSVTSSDRALDVQDALRRAILRRLRAEGIPIPFPTTTVEITRVPRG